jgi:hypothetical protein
VCLCVCVCACVFGVCACRLLARHAANCWIKSIRRGSAVRKRLEAFHAGVYLGRIKHKLDSLAGEAASFESGQNASSACRDVGGRAGSQLRRVASLAQIGKGAIEMAGVKAGDVGRRFGTIIVTIIGRRFGRSGTSRVSTSEFCGCDAE